MHMINANTYRPIEMEQFTMRPGLEWKLSITPISILINNFRPQIVHKWLVALAYYMENK